ncbi:MAG TPA: alanine--tRNA ligase-related protein, partial [Fimbriimonadaceae bacterium]|nr:alanine--tRNA ligase-related protein [Fimbriimonadaceae bacterium]
LKLGMSKLDEELKGDFTGAKAFHLYETFGLPLDFMVDAARDAGVAFDEAGFEAARAEEQARARASWKGGSQKTASPAYRELPKTVFEGYKQLSSTNSEVLAIVKDGVGVPAAKAGELVDVVLDHTSFYGDSGGQIGDTGVFTSTDGNTIVAEIQGCVLPVQGVRAHKALLKQDLAVGDHVNTIVDAPRRDSIKRNHTGTHLLHAALRQVLGTHVKQAGSLVAPTHLRFDFSHFAQVADEELAEIETIVNREILSNTTVETLVDVPIDVAVNEYHAMALFGEKYGDRVRMVEIGDFSRELCGGTHLRATGEVGLFKITSESSAASGVRRIEAVTGEGAYAWVLEQTGAYYEAAARLKSSPKDVIAAIDRLHEQLREEKRKREKAETALARGESGGGNETQEIKGVYLWTRRFENVDQKIAAAAIDDAVAQNKDIVALGAIVGERVQLICKVGPEAATKGAHAGNLIKQVAPIVGGGGGGRAEFATAGGKDASKVDEALAAAGGFLAEML